MKTPGGTNSVAITLEGRIFLQVFFASFLSHTLNSWSLLSLLYFLNIKAIVPDDYGFRIILS